MTAHNGADKRLAEAKHIFKSGQDVGNVTASADPLCREGRAHAQIQGSADAPCSVVPIIVWGDAHMCAHKGRQLRSPRNKTWSCINTLPPRSSPRDWSILSYLSCKTLPTAPRCRTEGNLFWVHLRTVNTKQMLYHGDLLTGSPCEPDQTDLQCTE